MVEEETEEEEVEETMGYGRGRGGKGRVGEQRGGEGERRNRSSLMVGGWGPGERNKKELTGGNKKEAASLGGSGS